MKRSIHPLTAARRGGFITLLISVILLLVATIATMTVARAGLFEQKYAGLDVRGKEVHAAAVGGLELGVQWFRDNWWQLSWGSGGAGELAVPSELASQQLLTEAGADNYRHILSYELLTSIEGGAGGSLPVVVPVVVRAVSTATAEADSHVTKTVSAELMLGRVGLFHGGDLLDAPPLVVEGCMSSALSGPALHPHNGIAIGTTSAEVACIDGANVDLNGGRIVALTEPRTLSEAIFGLPVEQLETRLREIEQREPERVYVVDLDDSNDPSRPGGYSFSGGRHGDWRTSLDDAGQRPYILYFTAAAGCPRIRDDTVIHGLVYYAATDCANHDWGDATIHGTVAVSGFIGGLNATATVHGRVWDFSQGSGRRGEGRFEPGLAIVEVLQVPSSWRDF